MQAIAQYVRGNRENNRVLRANIAYKCIKSVYSKEGFSGNEEKTRYRVNFHWNRISVKISSYDLCERVIFSKDFLLCWMIFDIKNLSIMNNNKSCSPLLLF